MAASAVLLFLKKYWKPLAVISAFVLVSGYSYMKGRQHCANQSDKKALVETESRRDSVEEFREEADNFLERNEARIRTPDDKRDSCLLSGNPYETRCL